MVTVTLWYPLDSQVLYLSLWRCRHTVVAVLQNRREKAVSETVRMLCKNQLIVLSVLPTCSKENSEAASHHWIVTIPYASRKHLTPPAGMTRAPSRFQVYVIFFSCWVDMEQKFSYFLM